MDIKLVNVYSNIVSANRLLIVSPESASLNVLFKKRDRECLVQHMEEEPAVIMLVVIM